MLTHLAIVSVQLSILVFALVGTLMIFGDFQSLVAPSRIYAIILVGFHALVTFTSLASSYILTSKIKPTEKMIEVLRLRVYESNKKPAITGRIMLHCTSLILGAALYLRGVTVIGALCFAGPYVHLTAEHVYLTVCRKLAFSER